MFWLEIFWQGKRHREVPVPSPTALLLSKAERQMCEAKPYSTPSIPNQPPEQRARRSRVA